MEAVVTTGVTSRAKLQSNHHHQQTNTQLFLQAGCLSCHPTNNVKALKGKYHIHGLAYPKLTWGLPTLSLTTNSSWLPWGRVAIPLISPLIPVPQIDIWLFTWWKKIDYEALMCNSMWAILCASVCTEITTTDHVVITTTTNDVIKTAYVWAHTYMIQVL